MNLLDVAKAALDALETCDWDDNEFPDDSQHFDRFAVSEAATRLRAAIEEVEKQEPVAWIDSVDNKICSRSFYEQYADCQEGSVGYALMQRLKPLYLHPAPSIPAVEEAESIRQLAKNIMIDCGAPPSHDLLREKVEMRLAAYFDAAKGVEASYDRALEKLVMARRYIRSQDLDRFDAEWEAYRATQKEKP